MKKILLLIALFCPALATAENMPPGCYVADYYRTNPCWDAAAGYTEWTQFADRTAGVYYYGSAVETIIFNGKLQQEALNICTGDYNRVLGSLNSTEANRQEWIAYGNAQAAALLSTNTAHQKLVKKLRKACGTKCKKIK